MSLRLGLLPLRALPRTAPSTPRLAIRHYAAKPPKPGTEHLRPKKSTKPSSKPAPKSKIAAAAKATPKTAAPKPTPAAPAAPTAAQQAQAFTLEAILGSKGSPTLLYAHRPRSFVAGCYTLAGLSLGWCVYTYNLDRDTEGLPKWVGKVHWAGIAMMAVVVGVVGWYPTRIVQKIYAIPKTVAGKPTIGIELHRRPVLPFLPMKKIQVDSPKMLQLEKPFTEFADSLEKERLLETMGREGEGFVNGLINAPGRGIRWLKRIIGNREFIGLRVVEGSGYVLHGRGWVWERRGLERLCGSGKLRYE